MRLYRNSVLLILKNSIHPYHFSSCKLKGFGKEKKKKMKEEKKKKKNR